MATLEERVSRLEGGFEHLATKADLHALETRLTRWMIGLMLGSVCAAVAIGLAVDRLAG